MKFIFAGISGLMFGFALSQSQHISIAGTCITGGVVAFLASLDHIIKDNK